MKRMTIDEGKVNVARMCKVALGMKPDMKVKDMTTEQKHDFWAMSKVFDKGNRSWRCQGSKKRWGKGMKLLEAFIISK